MLNNNKFIFLGLLSILLWASLATLGQLLYHLPPFYVLAVSFLIGAFPVLIKPKQAFGNVKNFLWGTLGYYLYHFFLFYSFRFAPSIEANLINYLWPMIMVLLTPVFFPIFRLKYYHFIGCFLSSIGCVFLVLGKGVSFEWINLKGYVLAFGAAISWPLYSLVKKRLGTNSVWEVSGFCFGAGILCLLTHFQLEPRVVLQFNDALILFIMGVGPFGIAFYTWDLALLKGDSRIVGALSYLTPVLSTLGLIIFTGQFLTFSSWVAMTLIIGGASTGLLDFIPSKVLNKGSKV